MKADEIKAANNLINKIERLKKDLKKPMFYNSDYSGSDGHISYSGNSCSLASRVPGILKDMEAIGKRAIERELQAAIAQANNSGIEL